MNQLSTSTTVGEIQEVFERVAAEVPGNTKASRKNTSQNTESIDVLDLRAKVLDTSGRERVLANRKLHRARRKLRQRQRKRQFAKEALKLSTTG